MLAGSPECRVQAMRYGPRAWSMQYHVEIEPDTVKSLPTGVGMRLRPTAMRSNRQASAPGSLDTLADEADLYIDGFVADAEQLYRNFMSAAAAWRV